MEASSKPGPRPGSRHGPDQTVNVNAILNRRNRRGRLMEADRKMRTFTGVDKISELWAWIKEGLDRKQASKN